MARRTEEWGGGGGLGKMVGRRSAKKAKTEDLWDVFLSYRVNTDQKLVQDLYWRLVGTDVVVNGKSRKMRPFWDAECLRSGESWEVGFCNAICSSTLIVAVMSRNALANVEHLEPHSASDNVILEYALALALAEMKGTAIFPLFVGDLSSQDGEQTYSHYFKSRCHPTCPDIVVTEIEEKKKFHLLKVQETLGLDSLDGIQTSTVKEIIDRILKSQGYFVHGPESSAVKGAVKAIHECATRLIAGNEANKSIENFKFTTSQGEEVCKWLADRGLSQYTSAFVSLHLDSLRKVSRMTSDDLATVHLKFCSSTAIADVKLDNQDVGRRVFLEEAVQSLKGNPSTKTLQDQLNDYRDPKVSSLNLIGANHSLEVFIAKKSWRYFFILVLLALGLYQFYYILPALLQMMELAKASSVLTYGVQLSKDGNVWNSVICSDRAGGPCIFDSRILASRPEEVVTSLFPQEQEARYLKILAGTWQEIYNGKAPDMRVGILGALGRESTLHYRVVSDGALGQAWVQPGCSSLHAAGPSKESSLAEIDSPRWASLDESIGEVQCCLDSPGVHVCTRDGCLSGDHDAVKFNWHEANAMCQAQGWRLCRREELNAKYAATCCANDACGYNKTLVWTGNLGGLQNFSEHGRLYSITAFESVTYLTLDLGVMETVRGVQLQGGLGDAKFYGIACFTEIIYYALEFLTVGTALWWSGRQSPLKGVKIAFFGGLFFVQLISISRIITFFSDELVPSPFSGNTVCPTEGDIMQSYVHMTFKRKNLENFMFAGFVSFMFLIQLLRPRKLFTYTISGFFVMLLVRELVQPPIQTICGLWAMLAIGIPLSLHFLQARSKWAARQATTQDIENYETAWRNAGGRIENNHLDDIRSECNAKIDSILKLRQRIAFSSQFPIWRRLLFQIKGSGLGLYSRRHKRRQRTDNIDQLFEQAATLNDFFLDFIQEELESMCHVKAKLTRGPIKKPDRSLQKVVRKHFRDARCLTDLVRCVIVCESIGDLCMVLELFMKKCVVGDSTEQQSSNRVSPHDEETLLRDDHEQKKFVLCQIKDRFTLEQEIGYRDICMHLEVGWTIASESEDCLHFVTAQGFGKSGIRNHICEVQLMLSSMYDLKVGGFHDNFVLARNLLSS